MQAIDFRQVISDRLDEIGWSTFRLCAECEGEVGETTIYEFMRGESEMNAKALGVVFGVLGLGVEEVEEPVETTGG